MEGEKGESSPITNNFYLILALNRGCSLRIFYLFLCSSLCRMCVSLAFFNEKQLIKTQVRDFPTAKLMIYDLYQSGLYTPVHDSALILYSNI